MAASTYTANDIKNRALALTGGSSADGERLLPLCSAAASELESRLRQGVDVSDIEELFCTACALLALSMYATAGGAGPASVNAGGVSVSYRGGADGDASAAGLRRQAEALLAPYAEDCGFCFLGVQG